MNLRKIVAVVFVNDQLTEPKYDKEYYYFTDLDLAIRDLVVVRTGAEYKVVRVVATEGFTALERAKCAKWIVQKVDLLGYEKRLEKENLIQEMKAKLRERKEQMEELAIYRMLAKDDPTMGDMLNKLAELEGVDPSTLIPQEETKDE